MLSTHVQRRFRSETFLDYDFGPVEPRLERRGPESRSTRPLKCQKREPRRVAALECLCNKGATTPWDAVDAEACSTSSGEIRSAGFPSALCSGSLPLRRRAT